jgi:mannose-1-phosphate guanylyltransferase/mannose-1-phosphate guanylyltransferase/mannose-6-phosphate isomerase
MMITPVILSGGAGTRLWPLSREARPKQLLALTGQRTMLQMTAARWSAAPIVVANARHADEIERQLDELALLVLEPVARNTAPAIALAAMLAPADRPMLVMPSDHVIGDIVAFQAAVEAAVPAAQEDWLVTFGITPDRPETGYGYIRRGAPIAPGVEQVEQFLEKPDAATAQAFVADGRHVWNGGIFLFRPAAYLAALERHEPAVLEAARRAFDGREEIGRRVHPDAHAFASAPSISIDYAVMEKAERVAVVPVAMGWSDVGSWDALYDLGGKDAGGNLAVGEVVAIDSANCLIRSEGPAVAAVGVRDLIVIATQDAVLIVPRGESQRVKEAVDALKLKGLG